MKEIFKKIIEKNLEKSSDAINAQTITKFDINLFIDTSINRINPISIRQGSPVHIEDEVLCYVDPVDQSEVYLDMNKIIELTILPNGFTNKPNLVDR